MEEEEKQKIEDLDVYFYNLAIKNKDDEVQEIVLDYENRLEEYSLEFLEAGELSPYKSYIQEKDSLLDLWETELKSITNSNNNTTFKYKLIAPPCADWREELYRQALERSRLGLPAEYYDAELLAYWRDIYNPIAHVSDTGKVENWYDENTQDAWNPAIFNNPEALTYWLDFLEGNDNFQKYSISAIGRRAIVKKESSIRNLFNLLVKDISQSLNQRIIF